LAVIVEAFFSTMMRILIMYPCCRRLFRPPATGGFHPGLAPAQCTARTPQGPHTAIHRRCGHPARSVMLTCGRIAMLGAPHTLCGGNRRAEELGLGEFAHADCTWAQVQRVSEGLEKAFGQGRVPGTAGNQVATQHRAG
jgi:hypothetical protein